MAIWLAGAATGAVVSKTTWAASPACPGNRAWRISSARCDGVLPAENLSWKCVPTS